jgi:hypothetical protein
MTSGSGKTYRLGRSYLRQGIICGIAFLIFGVGSSLASYFNIDGSFAEPELGALIFAVFWSFPMMLAIWMIAAYYRERLILEPRGIVQHGVFRIRRFEHCEVRQVYWNPRTIAGIVVVKTLAEKIKIYLDNFTKPERAEIVQYLRTNFAEAAHENWPVFDASISRAKIPPKPSSPIFIWLLATILLGFTVANAIAWWNDLGEQFLTVSVINVLVLLWYLWKRRSGKKEQPTLNSQVNHDSAA